MRRAGGWWAWGPGLSCPSHWACLPSAIDTADKAKEAGAEWGDWFAGSLAAEFTGKWLFPQGSWDHLTDYVEQWLIRS